MRFCATLSLCMLASSAAAVPLEFSHQGTLADASGQALEGAHQLRFSLYESATASAPLWTQTLPAQFEQGHYAVRLGTDGGLDATLFDGSLRWLGIAVDDEPELGDRLAILSVPYALRASEADRAATVTGAVAWSQLTGVPADADALAELACAPGEVATWLGSAWGCAEPVPASLDAAAIDSGTLSIDRLPVGSSSGSVAPGDHVHAFSQITGELGLDRTVGELPLDRTSGDLPIDRTSGDMPYARLPVGTAANTVAAGDHTHSFAQITGNLDAARLSGTIDRARLPAVQAGGVTTCDSGALGTIRWTGVAFQGCATTGWVHLGGGLDGSSSATAAASCKQLKADFSALPDGLYWIDPDGGGSVAPQRLRCDMTVDGGGWTLVASNAASDTAIAGGTGRNNASYFLIATGFQSNPSTDADYIIGPILTSLSFTEARIAGVKSGAPGDRVDIAFPCTSRTCTYDATGGAVRNLATSTLPFATQLNITNSARYCKLDSVYWDITADSVFNANSNQSTVGGSCGTAANYDPNGGTYIGHGSSEGSFEGWYDNTSGYSHRNASHYHTWVR